MIWTTWTVLTLVIVSSLGAWLESHMRRRAEKADEREYENNRNESNDHVTFAEWKEEREKERKGKKYNDIRDYWRDQNYR